MNKKHLLDVWGIPVRHKSQLLAYLRIHGWLAPLQRWPISTPSTAITPKKPSHLWNCLWKVHPTNFSFLREIETKIFLNKDLPIRPTHDLYTEIHFPKPNNQVGMESSLGSANSFVYLQGGWAQTQGTKPPRNTNWVIGSWACPGGICCSL